MKCPKCNGTGHIADLEETGRTMRIARVKAGLSLRSIAKVMRITPAYLSDMELGRRNQPVFRLTQFNLCISKLSK